MFFRGFLGGLLRWLPQQSGSASPLTLILISSSLTAIVVKGSSTVMADVFANDVCDLLDLPIPKSRLHYYGGRDLKFAQLESTLVRLDEGHSEANRGKWRRMMDIPIVMVRTPPRPPQLVTVQPPFPLNPLRSWNLFEVVRCTRPMGTCGNPQPGPTRH